jgi:6-phosphogluconolactonase
MTVELTKDELGALREQYMKGKNLCLPAMIFLPLILAWTLCGCGIGPSKDGLPAANAEFLYVTADKQILGFVVDTSTGALSSPTATPGPDTSRGITATLVADPAGRFLFGLDTVSDAIVVFYVNASTGVLTPVSGSPFPIGPFGVVGGMAIDPTGGFLYVATISDGVAAFTVNGSTGAVSSVAESPFADLNGGPFGVVASPSGRFVYTSDISNPTSVVTGFAIDSNSGALTEVAGSPSPMSFNAFPFFTSVDASGKFFYAGLLTKDSLAAWSIDQTTGRLTSSGSPFTVGGTGLTSLVADPAGEFMYVAETDEIFGLKIDPADGALAPVSTSPFAVAVAEQVAVDPFGKFLYAANPFEITGFSIDPSTGALTALGPPVSTTVPITPRPTLAFVKVQ